MSVLRSERPKDLGTVHKGRGPSTKARAIDAVIVPAGTTGGVHHDVEVETDDGKALVIRLTWKAALYLARALLARLPVVTVYGDEEARGLMTGILAEGRAVEDGVSSALSGQAGSIASRLEREHPTVEQINEAVEGMYDALEVLHVRLFHEQGGQENSPWAAPLALIEKAMRKAEQAGIE